MFKVCDGSRFSQCAVTGGAVVLNLRSKKNETGIDDAGGNGFLRVKAFG